MVTIQPSPKGIERLRTKVEALRLTPADKAGPLMVEMDRECSRQFRQAFTTEGATSGSRWPDLSPRYAAWKRKVRPGRKILVFSGDTRERFLMPTNSAHVRQFIPPFTYRFGAASEKAWRHEYGVGEGKQRLPVRSVVRKTANDIKSFQRVLATFYIKRLRQVVGR
jgi:hypothetical protein